MDIGLYRLFAGDDRYARDRVEALEPISELTLTIRASEGDSQAAFELRRRILRCAVAVARRVARLNPAEASDLEESIPDEVFLRAIVRVRLGYEGGRDRFRARLYRDVIVVAFDCMCRNRDCQVSVSLDDPFETADGTHTTLREYAAGIARSGVVDCPGDRQGVPTFISGLDAWRAFMVRKAILDHQPYADIAAEFNVPTRILETAVAQSTARFYRDILTVMASRANPDTHEWIAEVGQRLPDDLKAVFLPWWIQRMPMQQIAAENHITQDAARQRLALAKAAIWVSEGSWKEPLSGQVGSRNDAPPDA